MLGADLLDPIYEAAAQPHKWPHLLSSLSSTFGARGATIFAASEAETHFVTSPGLEPIFERYVSEGWMEGNERGAPLLADPVPCFRTDTDVRSHSEIGEMPLYTEFLIPFGFGTAAGTVIQGALDDMVIMTLEGFSSEQAARLAIPFLDSLRPHLARALSVTSTILLGRSQVIVDALAMAGNAAAVVDASGKLRRANQDFVNRLGNRLIENSRRLALSNPSADQQFVETLNRLKLGPATSGSIVLPGLENAPTCVIHVLPIRSSAKDIFNSDGFLLLLASGANRVAPKADLLRILFDLTPTEAELARELANGTTLDQASARVGCSYSTARVHLRAIFLKTGVSRQTQLIHLLQGFAIPQ